MAAVTHEPWITAEQIKARVKELGKEITQTFAPLVSEASPLLVVPLLRGGFIFAADLVREIQVPLQIDFVELSSYHGGTESSGAITWHKKLRTEAKDRHVLIVEDIVDTGLTISSLMAEFQKLNSKSTRLASLLHKPARSKISVTIDFKGFTIEDRFVVGYGLDFDERFRELPHIAVVKQN